MTLVNLTSLGLGTALLVDQSIRSALSSSHHDFTQLPAQIETLPPEILERAARLTGMGERTGLPLSHVLLNHVSGQSRFAPADILGGLLLTAHLSARVEQWQSSSRDGRAFGDVLNAIMSLVVRDVNLDFLVRLTFDTPSPQAYTGSGDLSQRTFKFLSRVLADEKVPALARAVDLYGQQVYGFAAAAEPETPEQALREQDHLPAFVDDLEYELKEITGDAYRKLQTALLAAFPTREILAAALLRVTGENLNDLAGEGDLSEVVFSLIQDLGSRGGLADFLRGIAKEDPGRERLMKVLSELFVKGGVSIAAAPAPASPAPARRKAPPPPPEAVVRRRFKGQLTGAESARLKNALLSAFPSQTALSQLVSFGLDENLGAIAGGNGLGSVVFNLITWARSRGRVGDLLEAARERNSDNEDLRDVYDELMVMDTGGTSASSPAVTAVRSPIVDPPPPPRPDGRRPWRISPSDLQSLKRALHSAFPSSDALAQLCRYELGLNVNLLGDDLDSQLDGLIGRFSNYHDDQGGVDYLLAGALRQNSGNEDLREVVVYFAATYDLAVPRDPFVRIGRRLDDQKVSEARQRLGAWPRNRENLKTILCDLFQTVETRHRDFTSFAEQVNPRVALPHHLALDGKAEALLNETSLNAVSDALQRLMARE